MGGSGFSCDPIEGIDNRQLQSEEVDDNEEYTPLFKFIKELKSPQKFAM